MVLKKNSLKNEKALAETQRVPRLHKNLSLPVLVEGRLFKYDPSEVNHGKTIG